MGVKFNLDDILGKNYTRLFGSAANTRIQLLPEASLNCLLTAPRISANFESRLKSGVFRVLVFQDSGISGSPDRQNGIGQNCLW